MRSALLASAVYSGKRDKRGDVVHTETWIIGYTCTLSQKGPERTPISRPAFEGCAPVRHAQ